MGKKKNNGKSPKGRAGAKQKAQKGGPSNSSLMGNFVRSSDFSRRVADEDYDDDVFRSFRGFSQSPDYRNMPPRNPALKLRHQAITFVSASDNTPVETEFENKLKLSEKAVFVPAEGSEGEDENSELGEDFDDAGIQTNLVSPTGVAISENTVTRISVHSTSEMNYNAVDSDVDMDGDEQRLPPTSSDSLPFVVDTEGDESLATAYHSYDRQVPARAPSPARSDSSEEVVVFHGRNNANGMNGNAAKLPSKAPRPQQRSQKLAAPADIPSRSSLISSDPTEHLPSSSAVPTHINGTSGLPSTNQSTFPPQARVAHGLNGSPNNPTASSNPPQAKAKGWGSSTSKVDEQVNPNAIWAPAPSHPYWKKGKGRPRPDLNPSPAEIEAAENAPPKQSKIAFALPHTDGAVDEAVDPYVMKMVERLAKITRVQAKDDASPPTNSKKRAKMEARIANIAQLESELSPEHVQLARNMGAAEAARLEQEARKRGDKQREVEHASSTALATSSTSNTLLLNETTWTPSKAMVAYQGSEDGNEAGSTIASLQSDVKAVLREKGKAKQSSRAVEEDKILLTSPKPKRRGKRGRRKDNRQLRNAIVFDNEEDGVDEAAYDDYMANLAAQMDGTNEVVNTTQTFTSFNAVQASPAADVPVALNSAGADDDEDDWVDEDDDENFAEGMVAEDGSSESSAPIGQDLDEMSDMDSSELEKQLEEEEREQWEDEEDLRRRRLERKTDEEIARIFAKQEELGYHGDEMILENGEYGSFSDGVGDLEAARAGLANIRTFTSGGSRNKRGTRSGGSRNAFGFDFPDAGALADTLDQYGDDGFDIMDFDRPSLRPVKKGRRGKLPPDLEALSDEELRDTMADTWANDRAKKRLKKVEREELRAQGLLGSLAKRGKADLRQKYQSGMSTQQVHEELRVFLNDDGQRSRPFPPMDKLDRKALHDLANALGLKSKSVGMGNDRAPVLYKSSRTPAYRADVFDRAINASANGFLDRDRKYGRKLARKAAKGGKQQGGGGGGRAVDATVRNGEVVGAGAAEIGKENFGHRLMEKMGWSKGMALGKEGVGMLTPVEQVMRAGRGGLGG